MSKDRQTELATEVHVAAVVRWDRDHVPGLNNLSAQRTAQGINTTVEKHRMMAG